MRNLVLKPLELDLSVLRFPSHTALMPEIMNSGAFVNIARTDEELSIVCETSVAASLGAEKMETGFKAFKVQGPLDFSLTGILSAIVKPLADHKISIFAVSTFDTDYVLVSKNDFAKAKTVLGEIFTVI